jgi:A/G-specific adenine glycosylase
MAYSVCALRRSGSILKPNLCHKKVAVPAHMKERNVQLNSHTKRGSARHQHLATEKLRLWDLEELAQLRGALLRWYDSQALQLPWRQRGGRPDPYQVYVSEVMLQQTRVKTVEKYFMEWMRRFPTVEALAAATEEEVLQQWAGLGYYRRARMLHAGAKWIVAQNRGKIPASVRDLEQVPGIGVYTASAIASIAFGAVVPAIDGNATRVVSRLAGMCCTNVWKGDGKRLLAAVASELVDANRPGDWNQAVFDLGRSLCTAQVTEEACAVCPVQKFCRAAALPISVRQSTPYGVAEISEGKLKLQRHMPRVRARQELLLAFVLIASVAPHAASGSTETLYYVRRRASHGLLGGLWEVPNIVVERLPHADPHPLAQQGFIEPEEKDGGESAAGSEVFRQLAAALNSQKSFKLSVVSITPIPKMVRHLFTHIRQDIQVFRVEVTGNPCFLDDGDQGRWVRAIALEELGLSTQMRRVLRAAGIPLTRKRFGDASTATHS